MNTGIDYGMKQTNIDTDNNIRFGVISQNEVLQAWCDESEPYYPCRTCEHKKEDGDCQNDFCEPNGFTYNQDGYSCESDSYNDIFITKSPYYTYAQFCSPCAPGSCHLENPLTEKIDNNKCYCFGHDWFDDGKAPYTVYSIETNKVIESE